MKDRDAFALGAAVDNLIKITAGENGCRYSHALTACNMLPVSMGASCQDIFISKIQMPDRDNRNADFYFPNSVPNSDRVKRKIYLSRRKSRRHNKLSYKLSKEFRKRGEEEEKNWGEILPCRLVVYQLLPPVHPAGSTSRMQMYVHRSLFYHQPLLDRNQRL